MSKSQSEKLLEAMKPGKVYRRLELLPYSNNLSRDLKELVKSDSIVRGSPGLYYKPRIAFFGPALAKPHELVKAFLNDDDFLFISFTDYNLLGLGFTQVYNQQFVYNRKRHGDFELDSRMFSFRRPRNFPSKLTKEFLFVDLVNNINTLPEDTTNIDRLIADKIQELDSKKLLEAAKKYGKMATQRFFDQVNQ